MLRLMRANAEESCLYLLGIRFARRGCGKRRGRKSEYDTVFEERNHPDAVHRERLFAFVKEIVFSKGKRRQGSKSLDGCGRL